MASHCVARLERGLPSYELTSVERRGGPQTSYSSGPQAFLTLAQPMYLMKTGLSEGRPEGENLPTGIQAEITHSEGSFSI